QLAKTGLSPSLFCFEISAKTAIALPHQTHDLIAQLHQLGCQITLDDVVPSEAIIRLIDQLPLNYVKLSFTCMDSHQMKNPYLWQQLRKSLQRQSAQAIAKGIESPAILKAARAQDIHHVQGYQIERPQLLQT
ncbi:MAG: EAL domain-containing protein, partial [Phormidesmis sp.]